MANTNAPFGLRIYGNDQSSAIPMKTGYGLSTFACKVGDDLYMSTSGYLYANKTTGALWGIAAQTITATATAQLSVPFVPADKEFTLIGQSIGTTAVTQAKIGAKCWIAGSSGARGPSLAHTTNGNLVIVGLAPTQGNTLATYAQLLLKVVRNARTGDA